VGQGAGELLWAVVTATFFALPAIVSLVTLLDAARRPAWVWAFAGRNRAYWIGAAGLGILFCAAGAVVAVLWWGRVRPQLGAIEAGRFDEST
jgi:hypothetical protein